MSKNKKKRPQKTQIPEVSEKEKEKDTTLNNTILKNSKFLMIIVYAIIRESYPSQKDTIPSAKDIKLSNEMARDTQQLYTPSIPRLFVHVDTSPTTRKRKPVKSPIVINAEIATSSYSKSYGSSTP